MCFGSFGEIDLARMHVPELVSKVFFAEKVQCSLTLIRGESETFYLFLAIITRDTFRLLIYFGVGIQRALKAN